MRKLAACLILPLMLFLGGCEDDVVDDDVVGDATDDTVAEIDTEETDFDTLDANGDSYLDTDELAEWTDDVGTFNDWDADSDSELDPDEINGNVFEAWDENGNGTVSNDEWEDNTERWFPEDADVVVYEDVDLDGDSEIDADEFKERFDLSVLGETWTATDFDEDTFKNAYFEFYDADDDGKVTESEWNSGATAFGTPNSE